MTIYRGDQWPTKYLGNLLVGDVANNLVYRASVVQNHTGVIARRADAGREFLSAKHIWFRPVQFANGPDGCLFVLDMHRELIEGAAFLPPYFLKHLDATSGADRGRIFRIVAEAGDKPRYRVDLSQLSSLELVEFVAHRNGWHRDTAARLLYERQSGNVAGKVAGRLRELVATAKLPIGRATALHLLSCLRLADLSTIQQALGDESPQVRVQALRVAESHLEGFPGLAVTMTGPGGKTGMLLDRDIRVRYQLAFSAAMLPFSRRVQAVSQLAQTDGGDAWMRLALQSSVGEGAEQVMVSLLAAAAFRKSKDGLAFLASLAEQIGAEKSLARQATLLRKFDNLPESESSIRSKLVAALLAKLSNKKRQQVLVVAGGGASEVLRKLLVAAVADATNEKASVGRRVQAISRLRLGDVSRVLRISDSLLSPRQPQSVQLAAIDTLGSFQVPQVATKLLSRWPEMSLAATNRAIELLTSRSSWLTQLLDAVEAGRVPRRDLDEARLSLLRSYPNPAIAQRVQRLFGMGSKTANGELLERYKPSLKLGVASKGKLIFKKNCSACHQLGGVGKQIGAELRGISSRGMESVLLNILEPNREVKPKYLTYTIETTDGRVLAGMITSENANSIQLRQVDGKETVVPRVEIERLRRSGKSFMPEGLHNSIDVSQMADLLAFLREST